MRIVFEGDYAYVADYSSGLQVINITDPTTPTITGSYNTAGNAFEAVVEGNYAYLADDWNGLTVIDISDHSNPTFAGFYYIVPMPRDIVIEGNYAYLADGGAGLQVVVNSISPVFSILILNVLSIVLSSLFFLLGSFIYN